MRKILMAALFVGALVALNALAVSNAYADQCHTSCFCAPSEGSPTPGKTRGCVSAADNTAAVCGEASPAAGGPSGCVCVGGTCINNFGTVPAAGCPGATLSGKCN